VSKITIQYPDDYTAPEKVCVACGQKVRWSQDDIPHNDSVLLSRPGFIHKTCVSTDSPDAMRH
jgi:hypothetical protein